MMIYSCDLHLGRTVERGVALSLRQLSIFDNLLWVSWSKNRACAVISKDTDFCIPPNERVEVLDREI